MPKNTPAEASASAEKQQPLSRPMTPTGVQPVGDDVMLADRVPEVDSTYAERPRSVFGRLRDASKSRSRPGSMVFGTGFGGDGAERKSPGPSRSISRAASMVLGTGSRPTTPAPAVPVLETSIPPVPAVTRRISGPPGILPDPMDRRKEAWEDDDAEVGDASWREENGRLGVLPSPSVMESVGPPSPGKARKGSWIGEPVDPPLQEVRGEEDAAAAEHGGGSRAGEDARWALPPAAAAATAAVAAQAHLPGQETSQQDTVELPGQAPTAEPINTGPEQAARRSSLDNAKTRGPSPHHAQTRSASYAVPSPAVARPQTERKVSALDGLPSQQRRRQMTPATTPRRLSLDDGEVPDPILAPMGQNEGLLKGEDPVADAQAAAQTKMSRPATPANWDMLSSPRKADEEPVPVPVPVSTSRRSSVSSCLYIGSCLGV